ncbi:hypothetical protein MJO52_08325 [Microbulbifer variabilis]|uniref:Uncharacterized protein n=1 Tax=Microbulbifer variabilis TaxID=266805 RepID=A0ABY4V6N3_9GAMM|nr:hypothetical protein [Microbulbifer variabilis]USD19658.1 hypothetical protein MJO52_11240 [Microbulbifer variabilis]USD19924.1 hypothetical protein MJO52_12635 [Microbulbifer variabilis]USD20060.1 hypothetical protein MJO52_13335 [Microbulbifer variabilis]USD20636.1 hypothetical protein MJO52_16380 [Microbulbifer variabilis]USD23128.1 hypothetical protein MJO52_08325 [Microbulbifer variabilis]
MHVAKLLALPKTEAFSNMYSVMDSVKEDLSIALQNAKPTGCLQNKPDYQWVLGLPFLVLIQEDMVRSISIDHWLTLT